MKLIYISTPKASGKSLWEIFRIFTAPLESTSIKLITWLLFKKIHRGKPHNSSGLLQKMSEYLSLKGHLVEGIISNIIGIKGVWVDARDDAHLVEKFVSGTDTPQKLLLLNPLNKVKKKNGVGL